MARRKKAKISKVKDKSLPEIENLVAKYAHLFNRCKVIDVDKKKYKRKSKHKEVYSDIIKLSQNTF